MTIINACKLISTMVWHATKQGEDGKPTGADEFLPVLIFTVLRAKPSNIFRSIEYIRYFAYVERV